MNNQILRKVALTRLAVAQSRKLEIEAEFAASKAQKLVQLETEVATLTGYIKQLEDTLQKSRLSDQKQQQEVGQSDSEVAARQLQESKEKVAELRRLLNCLG